MATVCSESLDGVAVQSEPDGLYEVVDGHIVEKPLGAYECWLAAVVFSALDRFNQANPIGRVVQEMIFDFRPHVDRERRPDVAFVSFARWGQDRDIPRARSWPVIPDLAIEIISLTNTADGVAEKLEEYFGALVRQVWIVYPGQSKVYVFRSTTSIQVLSPGDELDGGDILPGLRLSVREVLAKAGSPS
jgi:Uma2 family endonuclease